ncbi:glycosyl hydrolase [Halosquirtibacter laminarini]|uniref:Glycosyl hydrolase n=1 Tax=Halosquirtibacter laminarini TaxID=3374600 RepID=A0AC61NBF9_9BACT|nr:glycosyl hydrolase [Prolixibacteraceae bacterium]
MINRGVLIGITLIASFLLSSCGKTKKEQRVVEKSTASVFETSKGGNGEMNKIDNISFYDKKQPYENEVTVFVDPSLEYQEIRGIGGAITDASAEVYDQLSKETQKQLMDAYYGEGGLNYTIIRTPIHSSDFSSSSFTYLADGDTTLQSFSIDHDRRYRIPMIKEAISRCEDTPIVYASPWSPPAFMKTNNDMLHGGSLKPEYAQMWVDYFVKFIESYEAEGIPIWGLTVQNEPMAIQRWESCIYTASQERDFIKNHLGPTLHEAGYKDKKLIVWDHNRDLLFQRGNTILSDPEARKYVWGVGFHWYEIWAGGKPMFQNERALKEAYKDIHLVFTEGCNEGFEFDHIRRWSNAERYGESMIQDFNHGTTIWTDWNILLNEFGGPNHVHNLCFAPVHAMTEKDSLIFTPTYYYIGHFSKFISKGTRRVSCSVSRSTLQATSFKNSDGEIVLVVMNKEEDPIRYKIQIGGKESIVTIPAHAMQTIIF